SLPATNKFAHSRREIGVSSLRLKPPQEIKQWQDPGLAARQPKIGNDAIGKRNDCNAIEISQCDVGERGCDLPCQIKLRRIPKSHAPRAVQQKVNVQVFFLLKPLEQQVAMPRINVPVEIPQVIARGIFAKIRELDSRPKLQRPPLSQKRAPKHPSRHNRQVLELLQKVRIKKRHVTSRYATIFGCATVRIISSITESV